MRAQLICLGELLHVVGASPIRPVQPQQQRIFAARIVTQGNEQAIRQLRLSFPT